MNTTRKSLELLKAAIDWGHYDFFRRRGISLPEPEVPDTRRHLWKHSAADRKPKILRPRNKTNRRGYAAPKPRSKWGDLDHLCFGLCLQHTASIKAGKKISLRALAARAGITETKLTGWRVSNRPILEPEGIIFDTQKALEADQ